ncbi:unnamed protein product [Rhizoctonia solani]|uniref:HMG box domain-containing protein n=1 Tax=Rhizoctonia solani TaxID=456999 RepID=A0A8H3A8W4_9AGAM|nr:unnamed protein product [Rhizoctonia solani]
MPMFNNEDALRALPEFRLLDDHIQSIVLRMLKDDRLNNYGSLKRPPNAWLIFRSDMLTANSEMSSISQAEVTTRCKAHWLMATPQERMELQARAQQANDELIQYFPDYTYKPMSKGEKERWKELGMHQKKQFWLSSAVRIAERIAYPGNEWGGFLTLKNWMDDHTPATQPTTLHETLAAIHPPETGNTLESILPPPPPIAARSQQIHVHESPAESQEKEPARTRRQVAQKIPPPGPLKDVLVHIGPQASNTQRRRLVLSMFQLKDKLVWVSEEVDDDVPDDIFEYLSKIINPDETAPNQLVLHDYADPWIPEATDKYGEIFCPEIGSVSEYHEYMSAYYFAQENSLDFIWPPPPQSPPSPHASLIESTAPLVQTSGFYLGPQCSNPLGNDFDMEASPPDMPEPVPGTNFISELESGSVPTPEDDLGWGQSVSFNNDQVALEGHKLDFESLINNHF